jgi:hypothetical protein
MGSGGGGALNRKSAASAEPAIIVVNAPATIDAIIRMAVSVFDPKDGADIDGDESLASLPASASWIRDLDG